MKIAIIDSGIDQNVYDKNITDIRNYTDEGEYDYIGHGTNCYKLICSRLTINVEYIIVKVLNEFGGASIENLYDALYDLLDENVDIICMAISINTYNTKLNQIEKINDLCKKMSKKGTTIVCSYSNRDYESFPASIHNVLGVYGNFFLDSSEYWYCNSTNDIVVDCTPICIRGLENKRNFFSGNSKACALATAIVANKLNEDIDIKKVLDRTSVRKVWEQKSLNSDVRLLFEKKFDILKLNDNPNVEKKELIMVCKEYLSQYLKDDFFTNQIILDDNFYERIEYCETILSRIENYYGFSIYEGDVLGETFININSLYYSVCRWKNEVY